MTFKSFIIGLLCSFGLPVLLIVIIPFASMQAIEPVRFNENDDGKEEVYVPRRAGRVTDGAEVYAANGCYTCHSQLIRPTYSAAASEVWREDWAGRKRTEDNPETRRETTPWDYQGETFAQIGLARIGPDLSNVGHRITREAKKAGMSPEEWLFQHLDDPTEIPGLHGAKCPPNRFMFTEARVAGSDRMQRVPKPAARALASYLLSLKKDDPVPYSINNNRNKKRAIEP
jgi:cytochrome c oxidase cbb3-type subunit 2